VGGPTEVGVELLLFDSNTNVLVVANGNLDGLSTCINFTVPPGYDGLLKLQIVDSPSVPNSYGFDYTVTISGNTAGAAYLSDVYPRVPEPSSFLLLGSGLAGFAGVIRRKLNR
jgi:hypothetical protein